MKQSDIAALIVIASITLLVAYFVADFFIGSPTGETQKVDTITKIDPEVKKPDSTIFNKDAINPTVEVVIGDQ
jgi:hypothetical protein